jgi:hypothetical protein
VGGSIEPIRDAILERAPGDHLARAELPETDHGGILRRDEATCG